MALTDPNTFLETISASLGIDSGLYPGDPGLPEGIAGSFFPAEFLDADTPGIGDTNTEVRVSNLLETFFPSHYCRIQFALRLMEDDDGDIAVGQRFLAQATLTGSPSSWTGSVLHTFSHAPVTSTRSFYATCEYLRFQAHAGAPWEVFGGDLLPADPDDAALWP